MGQSKISNTTTVGKSRRKMFFRNVWAHIHTDAQRALRLDDCRPQAVREIIPTNAEQKPHPQPTDEKRHEERKACDLWGNSKKHKYKTPQRHSGQVRTWSANHPFHNRQRIHLRGIRSELLWKRRKTIFIKQTGTETAAYLVLKSEIKRPEKENHYATGAMRIWCVWSSVFSYPSC